MFWRNDVIHSEQNDKEIKKGVKDYRLSSHSCWLTST